MRRLLAFVLVLGLAPGAAGGLLEASAHCTHPCCQGQDFCHRGAGHDHEAEPGISGHHDGHRQKPLLAVTAVEPSSECVETCGVLRDARPKTDGPARAHVIDTFQRALKAPRPLVFFEKSGKLEGPASPRGPPR